MHAEDCYLDDRLLFFAGEFLEQGEAEKRKAHDGHRAGFCKSACGKEDGFGFAEAGGLRAAQ